MPGPVWLWCLVGAVGFGFAMVVAILGTPVREASELDGFPE